MLKKLIYRAYLLGACLLFIGASLVITSCDDGDDGENGGVTIAPPAAVFTPAKSNLAVTLTNTSTNATSYAWDFGDDNASLKASPTHVYDKAGKYPVTLVASGPGGVATTTDTVTVTDVASGTELLVGGAFETADADKWQNVLYEPAKGGQTANVAFGFTDIKPTGAVGGVLNVTQPALTDANAENKLRGSAIVNKTVVTLSSLNTYVFSGLIKTSSNPYKSWASVHLVPVSTSATLFTTPDKNLQDPTILWGLNGWPEGSGPGQNVCTASRDGNLATPDFSCVGTQKTGNTLKVAKSGQYYFVLKVGSGYDALSSLGTNGDQFDSFSLKKQ